MVHEDRVPTNDLHDTNGVSQVRVGSRDLPPRMNPTLALVTRHVAISIALIVFAKKNNL